MKTKTMYLVGAGVLAYFLYKRSVAAKADVPAAVAPQTTAGALGAVMTGNAMLEELGSLGSHPAWKGTRGY